jgi:lambda repressor-like predicted transcriptional regulator
MLMISRGIQRILAVVTEKGPLSLQEISQYAFIASSTLSGGRYLKQLRDAELIHVGGWRKASNGFSTPLYKAGAGIDLPKPKFKTIDRDSIGMARIVAALKQAGTMTYRQIALASGLSHHTIKNARYMDALLEQKRVHIVDWQRNANGPMAAIYADGQGRNASPPKPLSRAEINCRMRLRQRLRAQSPCLVGQLLAA